MHYHGLASLLDSFAQFTKQDEPPVIQQAFLLKFQSRCVIPYTNMQTPHTTPSIFVILE